MLFEISSIHSENEGLIAKEPLACDTLIFKDVPLVWNAALESKLLLKNLFCIECGRPVGSMAEHLNMAANRAGIPIPDSAAAIVSKIFHEMKR